MRGQKFITILSTNSQGELAIIKSLLDNAGIKYFVTNENFNKLYAGVLDGASLMDIKIPQNKVSEARELLKDFILPDKKKRNK
jgi:hypothetical protein